jgi:hypothetical protein
VKHEWRVNERYRLITTIILLMLGVEGCQTLSMRRVRDWYRREPRWVRWINVFSLFFCSFLFVIALKESGPEFRAIRWHHRHGDRITVNGVTFPVYYWWSPTDEYNDLFTVHDKPGPFRPTDDEGFTQVEIWGLPEEPGTSQLIVAKTIADYEKAGYHGARRVPLTIRMQQLECVEENDERLPPLMVSCFGDGPIYWVFFSGPERSRKRFDHMIAEAR